MAVGAWGLWLQSVPLLLLRSSCLGTHSTVFGPIKYALLPQHLRDDELVAGNALIEAGTFLAILLGTIVGSSARRCSTQGRCSSARCGVVDGRRRVARRARDSAGAAGGRPRAAAARLVRDTVAIVRLVTGRPEFLLPVLAISWFWLVGATVVSGLPVFAKDVLFANEQVVTLMLALFAAGVGVGSDLAERLLHGEVSARHVPVAALVMAICAIDLHAASAGRTAAARWLASPRSCSRRAVCAMLVDLLVLAAAGGLFTVPLYALLQHASEPAIRARVIAGNNIINAVAMTVARRRRGGLLASGLTMGELFALCGGARPVALLAALDPAPRVAKTLCGWCCALLYRVEVQGLEHARAAFPHAVVAANHASFLDGLLLGAFLPGDPIFAVDTSSPVSGGPGRFSPSSTLCRSIPPTRCRFAR